MEKKRNPVIIPIEVARELVAPNDFEDVLSSLYEFGAIEWFIVGQDSVTVQPIDDKHFDIALTIEEVISEINQAILFRRREKKSN